MNSNDYTNGSVVTPEEVTRNWNSSDTNYISEEDAKRTIISFLINSSNSLEDQRKIISILNTQYFKNLSQKDKDGFFLDAAEGKQSLLKNFVTFKAHNIIWHLYQEKLFDFKSNAGLEILYRMEQDLPHKLQQTKKLVNGEWYSSSSKKLSDPFSEDQRDEVYQQNKELGIKVLLEKLIMDADLIIKFICNERSYLDASFEEVLERAKTSRSRQFAHQSVKKIDDFDLTTKDGMNAALHEIRQKPIDTQYMIVQCYYMHLKISNLGTWDINQRFFYLSMIKEYLDNKTYSELYNFVCDTLLTKARPEIEKFIEANSLSINQFFLKERGYTDEDIGRFFLKGEIYTKGNWLHLKANLLIAQGITSTSKSQENIPSLLNEKLLECFFGRPDKYFVIKYFVINTILGTKVDLNYVGKYDGKYARSYLAQSVHQENYWKVYLFMTFGADINFVKANSTLHPIDYAVAQNDTKIVELLLSHPEIDISKRHLLGYSIKNENLKVTKLLLIYGADANKVFNFEPNKESFDHREKIISPLAYAIRKSNISLAKLLLKYGANPNGTVYHDHREISYLEYAITKDNYPLIELFQELEKKPTNNTLNKKSWTEKVIENSLEEKQRDY